MHESVEGTLMTAGNTSTVQLLVNKVPQMEGRKDGEIDVALEHC